MPIAPVNGIEICYESFGSPSDPHLLLIRGFGSQMVAWLPEFCEQLASSGFCVTRFDNRDVGLSSQLDGVEYTIPDMAADTVGLLDHLGADAAHIVGISMGGMIAQQMAIDFPERVLTLTSMASSIGGHDAAPPTPESAAIFLAPETKSRDEYIERAVADRRIIGSPGFPFDEEDMREIAAESYDRCYSPRGRRRQMLAIRSAPSRREALSKLSIPTVVIHGDADPLVPLANGERTAEAIPGAELVVIEGLAHDTPRGAWPQLIDAIVGGARRAHAGT